MHPSDEKQALRDAIKDRLSKINEQEHAAESRSLCRRILESLPPAPCTIAAYFPLRDEADIRPLLQKLLQKGYVIFLPKVESGRLAFRQMASIDTLVTGPYGILEPTDDSPLLRPEDLSIVLIPGRAFDAQGNRLGRGNGGYDIWIRSQRKLNPDTTYWGVALECQMVPSIPTEAHDEKVDAVITSRGFMEAKK